MEPSIKLGAMAPPGEYSGMICVVVAMPAVATNTVATCLCLE